MIPQDNPRTIADGLRTSLSERTFEVLSKHVTALATASEESIVAAMRLSWEALRIIVEPSSAVPLACLMERTLELPGREIGIVITGGNVDLDRLPWQA
jgi:threonine dehydratase